MLQLVNVALADGHIAIISLAHTEHRCYTLVYNQSMYVAHSYLVTQPFCSLTSALQLVISWDPFHYTVRTVDHNSSEHLY